jgi:formamidopyrimidine-DNA glycosylase
VPELPDVELARQRLQDWMGGATITKARSTDHRLLRPQTPAALGRALAGRKVRSVGRRGKWLRIELDDAGSLFSHLGMTGHWVLRSSEEPRQPSERARIDVVRPDGRASSLRYLDSRRFGRLVVANEDIPEWRELGPDPLADGIDHRLFAQALARTRRPVKVALLDQSILAGIGNILATEALWLARIDPRSRCDALSYGDVGKVARGLRTAIRKELAAREVDDGRESVDELSAYGRGGEACPRCGLALAYVVLGGRGTTFCKRCQLRRSGSVLRRSSGRGGH